MIEEFSMLDGLNLVQGLLQTILLPCSVTNFCDLWSTRIASNINPIMERRDPPRWRSSGARNPTSCESNQGLPKSNEGFLKVSSTIIPCKMPQMPPWPNGPSLPSDKNFPVLCRVNPPSMPGPTWTPDLGKGITQGSTMTTRDSLHWFVSAPGSRLFGNLLLSCPDLCCQHSVKHACSAVWMTLKQFISVEKVQ